MVINFFRFLANFVTTALSNLRVFATSNILRTGTLENSIISLKNFVSIIAEFAGRNANVNGSWLDRFDPRSHL